MNPLISVIIPVYNRSAFLTQCLESVANQTYRPIELLIVDDGSTDDTPNLVENFKLKQQDKTLIIKTYYQENNGAPAARNLGIQKSKGEFIQFLDSDDYLAPGKLKLQYKELIKTNSDLVYSMAQHITESGQKTNQFWGKPLQGISDDYFEFSWQTMCPLYKRNAINKIGNWNTHLKINQDWEYCIRSILSDLKITFLPEILGFFRTHTMGNIGDGIDFAKIKSKELSTTSVYFQLQEKNLLDRNLEKRFLKRYIYCLLHYSIYNKSKEFNKLYTFLKKEPLRLPWLANMLKYSPISNVMLKAYKSFN